MAIQPDDFGGNASQSQQTTGQQGHQQPQQPQQAAPMSLGLGLGQLSELNFVSGGVSAKALQDSADALSAMLNMAGETPTAKRIGAKFRLFVFDRNQKEFSALRFSAITIAGTVRDVHGNDTVCYHTTLLEATGEQLKDVRVPLNLGTNVGGNYHTVEAKIVTGDAYDEILVDMVKSELAKTYGKDYFTRNLGGFVLPRDVEAPAKDATQAQTDDRFRVLMARVLNALTSEMSMLAGTPDLSLASIAADKYQLQVEVGTGSQTITSVTGTPVRSDIRVTVRASKQDQQRKGYSVVNTQQPDIVLAVVHMYVDTVYSRSENSMYQVPGQPIEKPFSPMIVISEIELPGEATPSMVMLALSASVSVVRENRWLAPFYENAQLMVGKDINLRDIGALNIEGNFGGAPGTYGPQIDTAPTAMDTHQRAAFLGQMLNLDNLMWAIDVPLMHPLTPYLDFLVMMETNPVAKKAFCDIADNLTGGKFSPQIMMMTPPTDQNGRQLTALERLSTIAMTVNEQNIMHGGYWIAHGSQRRDLRDFDNIAVANYFSKSPDKIRRFAETWLPNIAQEIRLDERHRLSQLIAGETVAVTHRVQRVTLPGNIVSALDKAVEQTGVPLAMLTSQEGYHQQRQVASWVHTAGINPQNLNMARQPAQQVGGGYFGSQRGWRG